MNTKNKATTPKTYWTVKQNWNGDLWPRLWPNQKFAWRCLQEETGKTKEQILKDCDWSLVPVMLVEVPPIKAK